MPQGVVDVLESIEIEQQHRKLLIVAPRPGDAMGQALAQQGAVGQPREGVVMRQELELLLRLLDRADVAEYPDVVGGPSRTSRTALTVSHSGYTSPLRRRFHISPRHWPVPLRGFPTFRGRRPCHDAPTGARADSGR
jgi:hypothetical protein